MRVIPFERNSEGLSLTSALWENWSVRELLQRPLFSLVDPAALRRRCDEAFRTWGVRYASATQNAGARSAGGVLCAIGGAELAAGGLTIFAQNMTAGRGFMSFAAVIFGAGHPIAAAFAAMFFSLVGVAGIRLQLLFGASIPHDVLLSLPYMATILGVWISGRMRGGAKAATEASELRDY